MTDSNERNASPPALQPAGQSDTLPGAAIRWQAQNYRSYLNEALQRLASDPNPDVQRIGVEMNYCLSCPSTERCVECPFSRAAKDTVRGFIPDTRTGT